MSKKSLAGHYFLPGQIYILIILISVNNICHATDKRKTFNAGIQFGHSVNSICVYTKDLKYGRKGGIKAGIFVNHYLSDRNNIESGLFYKNVGTNYAIKQPGGKSQHTVSLNYIEFPVIITQISKTGSIDLRYGFNFCYLFDGDFYQFYKNNDTQFSIGFRYHNKKRDLFKKDCLIVQADFSIFSIIKEKDADLFNVIHRILISPNQRNIGVVIA